MARTLFGALTAITGLAVLSWLFNAVYSGAEILIVIGIPMLMLIGWSGLALLLSGLACLLRRREHGP
jgi:hypothetical protein